jgi:hypothetical protein
VSGYVEAGYAVVGVTLSAYGVWMSLRTRSINKAVGPARDGETGDTTAAEPSGWR